MEVTLKAFNSQGFATIDGQVMRDILKSFEATDADLDAYPSHWNNLGDDPTPYDFRKTSQTRWNVTDDFTKLERLQRSSFRIPYGKDKEGNMYAENAIQGKLERFFPEATPAFVNSTAHHACMRFMRFFLKEKARMEEMEGTSDELGYISGSHQFRIEMKPLTPEDEAKKKAEQLEKDTFDDSPTPEGVHQDGASVVMIIYINSGNMGHRSGESRIYTEDQPNGPMSRDQSAVARKTTRIAERNLATPFECFLLNDRVVKHDNKAITPKDKTLYAFRDVHVIWAREFNEDDKQDPRGEHPSQKVQITKFVEDALFAGLDHAS